MHLYRHISEALNDEWNIIPYIHEQYLCLSWVGLLVANTSTIPNTVEIRQNRDSFTNAYSFEVKEDTNGNLRSK